MVDLEILGPLVVSVADQRVTPGSTLRVLLPALLCARTPRPDWAAGKPTAGSGCSGGFPRYLRSHLRSAISLWRGQPPADIAGCAIARPGILRLESTYRAAITARIQADAQCGLHGALIGELRPAPWSASGGTRTLARTSSTDLPLRDRPAPRTGADPRRCHHPARLPRVHQGPKSHSGPASPHTYASKSGRRAHGAP